MDNYGNCFIYSILKVFETKNVTQAAEELFISQPALSRGSNIWKTN